MARSRTRGVAVRAARNLRMGGLYAAVLVPVGLAATLLSIASVEGAHHWASRPVRPGLTLAANVLPAIVTGFAAYFAIARWADRRRVLVGGIVGHALRALPLYVVIAWLGLIAAPEVLSFRSASPATQLVLWPWLAVFGGILGDVVAAWLAWPPARRPVAVVALSAAPAVAVLGGTVWMHREPDPAMFAAIGLPGPDDDVWLGCGPMRRRLYWHEVPGRTVTCSARVPDDPFGMPTERREIVVDAISRRAVGASRAWSIADSAVWQHRLDSIQLALHRRGGVQSGCDERSRHSDRSDIQFAIWSFPGHTVRLQAWPPRPFAPYGPQPVWQIHLAASRGTPSRCAGSRRLAPEPRTPVIPYAPPGGVRPASGR